MPLPGIEHTPSSLSVAFIDQDIEPLFLVYQADE
jgi:hypothetical protein